MDNERVKTYPFSELRNHPRKSDTNSLIEEGILKDNAIMFVGGPPKSYKSFVSNTVAVDLIVGRNLFTAIRSDHGRHSLAFNIPKPQRVLIFEQEIGEDDFEDRLKPLYESLLPDKQKLMDDNLFTHSLDHSLQFDTPEGLRLIDEVIGDIKPSVTIFDPLIEFHTSDENSPTAMAKVMRCLDWLRERHKFATIIDHHAGKEGVIKRSGGDAMRGASSIYGKLDTYLALKPVNRNASLIEAEFTVRRGKPICPFYLQLNPLTMRADFKDWKSRASQEKTKNAVGVGIM